MVRIGYERLAVTVALVLVVLAASQGSTSISTSMLVVAAGVVLVGAVLSAAVVVRELTVGSRARAHREAMSVMPEPRHPATAGLPQTRAPAEVFAA
jgi:disulfide bond formation protein DsbB